MKKPKEENKISKEPKKETQNQHKYVIYLPLVYSNHVSTFELWDLWGILKNDPMEISLKIWIVTNVFDENLLGCLHLTYLAKGGDEHAAGDKGDARCQRGEKRENHENIADMHVSDVDKLIADNVVAVVGASWSCHRVAVKIKYPGDNRED
jgi:hypothetical protein